MCFMTALQADLESRVKPMRSNLGYSFIRALDLLTIGMVNDMYVESNNDQDADKHYHTLSSQEDFDKF